MKPNQTRTLLLTCGFALLALPSAFAGDPDKADKKIDKMDTNGDGLISRTEHTASIQRMFAMLDADNDGAVTAAEVDAKKEAPHNDMKRDDMGRHEQFKAEKFKALDKNGDGRVTLEEASTGCDALFDKMDTNHDGSLSKDELEAGHKAKKETHD